MSNNKMIKNPQYKKQLGAVIATVCLTCSTAFNSMAAGLFGSSDDSYRSISVYQLKGIVDVERDAVGRLSAYNNMQLVSRDAVTTGAESELYLKLDNDKYMLAGADTEFNIVAEGTKKNSKTKIELKKGSIINRVDAKLGEGESYEVATANSTMAVRGTKFKISVNEDEQGITHSVLSVYDGNVEVRLARPDGGLREPVMIEAGKQVRIGGNTDNAYFELDQNRTAQSSEAYAEEITEGASLSVLKKGEVDFLMEKKAGGSTGNIMIRIEPSKNSGGVSYSNGKSDGSWFKKISRNIRPASAVNTDKNKEDNSAKEEEKEASEDDIDTDNNTNNGGKPEYKPEDNQEENPEGKPEENQEDATGGKPDENQEDTSGGKPDENQEDTSGDKPEEGDITDRGGQDSQDSSGN